MLTEYLKMSPNIWVSRKSWRFEADQKFDNKYNQQLDSILICDCSVTEDIKMS